MLRMLMVVAPLEQELAGLRRALRWGQRRSGAFEDDPRPWELHAVGVGQTAPEKVRALLTAWMPGPYPGGDRLDGLLLLGFAGSLELSLRVGDLVLPARYYGDSQGDFFQPGQEMFQEAMVAVSKTQQTVFYLNSLTVDHLVATPQEKQALRQRYPVGTVNMEDYWVAAAARDAGVPFLAVRAVLDVSTQRLPGYLLGLSSSRNRAALSLATRPWRVPAALGLARQAAVAAAALARFALAFRREPSMVVDEDLSGTLRR
jgi:adenosylhomocysteine nucleosidase